MLPQDEVDHTVRYIAIIFCFAILTSLSFAENKAEQAAALIAHAKQVSDIRAEGSPAFVLRAEFKILRDSAHPITGSYTENWASRALSRTEISAGEFKKTEVINDRKRWELTSGSEMPKDVSTAANRVAYRLDRLPLDSRGPAKVTERTNASWTLRCIVGHDDALGGRQELCFEKSSGQFVAESTPFASQGGELVSRCAFVNFQKFGDKRFPKSIQCFEGEKPVFEAEIVQLTFAEPIDKSVYSSLPGAKEFPNCPVELKHPEAIDRPDPSYRGSAGPTVVSLVVGTDGKAKDMKIVTSAGPGLDSSALEALRHWRFKPASCAGEPMETSINVEFVVRSN